MSQVSRASFASVGLQLAIRPLDSIGGLHLAFTYPLLLIIQDLTLFQSLLIGTAPTVILDWVPCPCYDVRGQRGEGESAAGAQFA